jgi:peptide/nickel transport system substrate-binding protein
MPNPAMFVEKDADAKQKEILGLPADEVPAAWGEFDKFIEETYYPAVTTGYSGTAIIRGSKIGGMFNDSVRGMPTLSIMYTTS